MSFLLANIQRIFVSWTPLYYEKMYAILPKDYPLNGREKFPLQEFEGLEFLMPYGRFDQDVFEIIKPLGIKLNSTLCTRR